MIDTTLGRFCIDNIILLVGITFFSYPNFYRVVFGEKFIYCPSGCNFEGQKIQLKVTICYENIVDVVFIRSINDSKNRRVRTMRKFYNHFIEFRLIGGKKERICVTFFSKKQKTKLLNEINDRVKSCGNNIEFLKAKESIDNLGLFGSVYFIDMAEKQKKQG